MRYWFDTEFIEDGKTIDLLSIGMVCEDGRELYLENSDADWSKASDWVHENVLPKLAGPREPGTWLPRKHIAEDILNFIGDDKPEFWAYYADYDWVVFCQLFGRMIDLPEGWPKFCMDLKQLIKSKGDPKVMKMSDDAAHNALSDALWCKIIWHDMQSIGHSDGT